MQISTAPIKNKAAATLMDESLSLLTEGPLIDHLRRLRPRFQDRKHPPSREYQIFAYAIARTLRVDDDDWQSFCMAPEWRTRRRRPDLSLESRQDALAYVVRFLCGSGASASVPIKKMLALFGPHWDQQVTARALDDLLERGDAVRRPRRKATILLLDNEQSRMLLSAVGPCKATLKVTIFSAKARAKPVMEIHSLDVESHPGGPSPL
ncbi:hypothetical protein GOB18_07925 [Sinorhizobium meliloti]|nr:hypothetical protein [Sinorhizobium meliloti]MDW9453692.1 hypothetical protein [Sinorhizobium meliloti]